MRGMQLARRATLVICAVSLVGQWLEEAKSKLDGSNSNLRLYMYHGSSRKRDPAFLATNFDLIVTTYQVGLTIKCFPATCGCQGRVLSGGSCSLQCMACVCIL